ncbi:MAG: DUF6516 family protein [Mariprofundaceae bacterium]
MKAVLILRHKDVSPEGWITEMVIWRVPQPVPPCTHLFKYSLALVVNDERVIGFDNERGKGDHYHADGDEKPYLFTGLEKLVDDFIKESEKWKSEH